MRDAAGDGPPVIRLDAAAAFDAVRADVVGREEQLAGVLAVLSAGRDLLLEGPPGTSKSTILRAVTRHLGVPFVFVEGNGDLTPAKLLGHHNPAEVLRHGYRPEDFVFGPLPEAMRAGGFLYLEEFNRMPEDTLNTLLTAMAERELSIPRVGRVVAEPTFRVVAAMNPFDNIGTTRVSVSVYDRLCRLAIGYQSAEEERRIVARRTGTEQMPLIDLAVDVVRATREHPELRSGSSVRGTIDFVLLAAEFARMRNLDLSRAEDLAAVGVEVACLALSSKVAIQEPSERTPEDILTEIVLAATARG